MSMEQIGTEKDVRIDEKLANDKAVFLISKRKKDQRINCVWAIGEPWEVGEEKIIKPEL